MTDNRQRTSTGLHEDAQAGAVVALPPGERLTEAAPQHISDDIMVMFAGCDTFLVVLRERVDEFFSSTGRRRRDCTEMYVKTAAIALWVIVSYVLLVAWATTWWQALLLSTSLGLAMAGVGFNIQHDGGHSAYSSRKWVNNLLEMTVALLGGSS